MSPTQTIPMLRADGSFERRISVVSAQELPESWLKRNRRGHLQHVRRPAEVRTAPLLAGGSRQHFVQELPSGRPWALKGVRGS